MAKAIRNPPNCLIPTADSDYNIPVILSLRPGEGEESVPQNKVRFATDGFAVLAMTINPKQIWGCTGFDGGSEAGIAGRGA